MVQREPLACAAPRLQLQLLQRPTMNLRLCFILLADSFVFIMWASNELGLSEKLIADNISTVFKFTVETILMKVIFNLDPLQLGVQMLIH